MFIMLSLTVCSVSSCSVFNFNAHLYPSLNNAQPILSIKATNILKRELQANTTVTLQ